jgi:hypothetical protein
VSEGHALQQPCAAAHSNSKTTDHIHSDHAIAGCMVGSEGEAPLSVPPSPSLVECLLVISGVAMCPMQPLILLKFLTPASQRS